MLFFSFFSTCASVSYPKSGSGSPSAFTGDRFAPILARLCVA